MSPKNRLLDIQELREHYEQLNRRKIRAEANLQTSTASLENLKKQARESYGTDDLEQLQAKLREMQEDNERRRAQYQQHITEIEANLAAVEQAHAEVQKGQTQP